MSVHVFTLPITVNVVCVCVCVCEGETASNLGTAMDELMRHQPTLKTDAMTAIIKVLFVTLAVL